MPPGFEQVYEKKRVFKLRKTIYGLPQSSRNWYIKLRSTLFEIGFKSLVSENCIFIHSKNCNFTALVIYIDDFTIVYSNKEEYNEILLQLKAKFEIIETIKYNTFLNITLKNMRRILVYHKQGISINC